MEKDRINSRFVEAVNYIVKSKGVNKAAIAQALDIKPAKFSEILNCRMNAGTDSVALLCAKYGISTKWMLLGDGDMTEDDASCLTSGKQSMLSTQSVRDLFRSVMQDRDQRLIEQSEEIGRLKEQIRQLIIEKENRVSDVSNSCTANVV